MSERYIGRFAVMDGIVRRLPRPSVDASASLVHVGSFHGSHYTAERGVSGNLEIFAAVDDWGNAAQREMSVEGTSGIRSSAGTRLDSAGPQSIAELNQLYARTRGAVGLRPTRR
jgi:hypothetical protein